MAKKKLNLTISDPLANYEGGRSGYREFTKNYRQSSNVEDRRGEMAAHRAKVASSGRTPVDAEYGTRTPRTKTTDGGTGGGGIDPFTGEGSSGSTTRKVDPDEAVRRTSRDRY